MKLFYFFFLPRPPRIVLYHCYPNYFINFLQPQAGLVHEILSGHLRMGPASLAD